MASTQAQFSKGVELIHFERLRQIEKEGYEAAEDDTNRQNESLALAAACYALPEHHREYDSWWSRGQGWHKWGYPRWWPWASRFWKPTPTDRIRELTKAGALIAAEIDRLHRLKARLEADQ